MKNIAIRLFIIVGIITLSLSFQAMAQCGGPAISGPSTVCAGASVRYTASPNPSGNLTWSINGGGSFSGPTSFTFETQILWTAAGTWTISVNNSSCPGTPHTFAVTVVNMTPAAAPVISGPQNICPNTSTIYSVPALNGHTPVWSIFSSSISAASLPILTPSGNQVTVNWPNITSSVFPYVLSVGYTNGSCMGNTGTMTIFNNTGNSIVSIGSNGTDKFCLNQSFTFTASSGDTADLFTWSLSGGGSLTPSSNGGQAVVNWTVAGTHTITVTATNPCNATPRTISRTITVGSSAPPAPGPISKQNTVTCINQTERFSIAPVPGATSYIWNGNANGSWTVTTTSPFLDRSFTSNIAGGTISVVANNGFCSGSSSPTLSFNVGNIHSLSLSAPDYACVNSSITLSAQSGMDLSGLPFEWIVGDGVISGNANSATINVTWPTPGRKMIIFATNTPCGIMVYNPFPSKVIIVQPATIPTPSFSGTTQACLGAYTYTVSFPNGLNQDIISTSNWSVTPATGASIAATGPLLSRQVTWNTPGNYTLRMNYANSCGLSAFVDLPVTVSNEPKPIINFINPIQNETICSFGPSNYSVNLDPAYSYTWSLQQQGTNNTITATLNNATVNWMESGQHFVNVTPARATCQGEKIMHLVLVSEKPIISFTNPILSCFTNDMSLPYSVVSGTPNGYYSIDWASLPDLSYKNLTPGVISVPVPPGVHTGTLVIHGTYCNSTYPISATINGVHPGLISGTRYICQGGDPPPMPFASTLSPSGNGALSYQWESSTNGTNYLPIPGATGLTYDPPPGLTVSTYYRRVAKSTLNGHECSSASDSNGVFIELIQGGTISGASNRTICSYSSVTLNVDGGTSGMYQWQSSTDGISFSNISSTGSTYTIPAGSSTKYYRRMVTVTSPVTCSAFSSIVLVTVNNITPGILAGNQTICPGGDPSPLTFSTPPSGTGPLSYRWARSINGGVSFQYISGATSSTYDPPPSLTTYYKCFITSTGGSCEVESNVITISAVPTFSPGQISGVQSVCSGGNPTILNNVSAGSSGTYQWQSSPDGITYSNIIGATGASYDPPSGILANTHYVRLTLVTMNGTQCQASSNSVLVTVNPLASFTVSPASPSICAGGSVVLSASGATSYTWSPATGLSATTGSTVTATPSTTTTYTVTGLLSNGCIVSRTVTVTVNPLPILSFNPSNPAICPGQSVSITASGASTYSWSPSTGLSATTGATVTASPTANRTYTVTGTSASGCVGNSAVTVTVNPLPTINISPTAPSICLGSSVSLTASGGVSYSWSPSTGLSSTTGATVTANPVSSTTYTITGTGSNACVNTRTVTVSVQVLAGTIFQTNGLCPGVGTDLYISQGTNVQWSTGSTGLVTSINNPGTYSVTYNFNGCAYAASIFVDYEPNCSGGGGGCPDPYNPNCPCTVGPCARQKIEKEKEALDFGIYPNPADAFITLQLPQPATKDETVTMTDQMGRTVNEYILRSGEQVLKIPTEQAAGGLYLLQIGTGEAIIRKKVMITHQK